MSISIRFSIPLFIAALALVWMGTAAPAMAQIESNSGTLQPDSTEVPGQGIYDTPPEPPPNAGEAVDEANPKITIPTDPDFDPSQLAPDSPPTEVGRVIEPQAPEDYTVFENTNLNSDPGGLPQASTVDEPSLGVDGRVVFYTANWLAGFSGDGGQTFSYVNPFDNFPADGTNDQPANAGTFCCDQLVYYDRTRGIMIWLLQYTTSGNNPNQDTNVQRLAIANSQEDIINNNWYWYDFEPGDIGYSSTGRWLDFPHMSVGNDHLYYTTNVFNIGSGTTSNSVVVKIPLDELATGGTINFRFWNLNRPSIRAAHGSRSRMYLGTHVDNNTVRLYYNDAGSTTLNSEDIDHAGFQTGSHVTGCSGNDAFGNRSDSRVQGAWHSEASDEIGLMWNAAAGGNFPFPYVRVLRISRHDWSVQQQISIWNNNVAFLYPSVHVNDRGHLGGTITVGCGNQDWPDAAAWVVDDTNGFPDMSGQTVTPFAVSDDAPADSSWGDYLATRRMVPYGNTWVGTGFRMNGGGNDGDVVPEFIWFGRERDMPPAQRTVFVDLNNTSGYETGTAAHPYDTVGEGEFALQPDDELVIRAGSYIESVLFDTKTRVDTENGSVIIE